MVSAFNGSGFSGTLTVNSGARLAAGITSPAVSDFTNAVTLNLAGGTYYVYEPYSTVPVNETFGRPEGTGAIVFNGSFTSTSAWP